MTSKDPKAPGGYRYAGEALHRQWKRLHRGDCEPWPDGQRIAALARQAGFADLVAARGGTAAVAEGLQEAWRQFHAGDFVAAVELGDGLGAPGASVANKAVAVRALYPPRSDPQQLHKMLTAAIARGEGAVAQLSDYPNAHYMLALVLGRYSQRLSILKALAQGLAGRVRTHLERTLKLEPHHAEAHVAFGLYHAEIVGQLGALAARLTYGASAEAALGHFRRAAQLAPASAIVHIEHARGLLRLDAERYREQAQSLYQRAAACEPRDAMEDLDVGHARRGLPDRG